MRTKAVILTTVMGLLAGGASAHFIPLPVKWSQTPWDFINDYWLSDHTVRVVMVDDFECDDPEPIVAVRWWGSYPTGGTHQPGPFDISFHLSEGDPRFWSTPGMPVAMYTVTPQEVSVGVDSAGVPVFRYDAYLPEAFDQYHYSRMSPNVGKLFLDICKPSGEGWGWREVAGPHPRNAYAVLGTDHGGPWTSTDTDMAFELMTPGPATLAMLGLGGLALLRRRRHR